MSWGERTRIGGVASLSAETNALDNYGLKPWRLGGAHTVKAAIGSGACSMIFAGSNADVDAVWVWDTRTGAHPATSIAPNATTATRLRVAPWPRGTARPDHTRTGSSVHAPGPIQSDLRLIGLPTRSQWNRFGLDAHAAAGRTPALQEQRRVPGYPALLRSGTRRKTKQGDSGGP